MIKYLLNKNEKKIKIFSLLNEEALNRFFQDRKLAINYMDKTYNSENKINILNEIKVEENYNNLSSNTHKNDYIDYYRHYRTSIKLEKNPYIDSINFNPHSNKYEEQYNRINKITKLKNSKNNKNISGDLMTCEEIENKLKDILKKNDNVTIIDYLLFDNYTNLWKFEYFFKREFYEKINKLIIDKNVNELITDSNKCKTNKAKHRKKNKKNNNNNKKEEEKNSINIMTNNDTNANKIKNEYEGIFKDEEEAIYAPYYLKANTEQKRLYNKIKEQNESIINHKKEIEEIKNFISKEIILGLLIERIFLIPLNNCLDFYEKFQEDNKIIEQNEIKKEEELIKEENNIKINIKEEPKEEVKNLDNISDDDLSLKKSESLSITTQDTNLNNINLSLETPEKAKSSDLKKKYNNENENENDNSDNKKSNNNSENKSGSKQKKKREKEQTFFLFDTVKKKKKKSNSNNCEITLVSNEFSIITTKEQNSRLSFFDKLHNA